MRASEWLHGARPGLGVLAVRDMKICPRCGGTGQIITPEEIARELRTLRQRAGVSQMELGRRLKISGASISQVESGRRPINRRWLRRYEEALRCR